MFANQIFKSGRYIPLGFLLTYLILNLQTGKVLSELTVTQHPKDATLKIGEDVTLVCKFNEKPPDKCMWVRGFNIFAPDGIRIAFVGNYNTGDCSILIRNVTINDNGRYVCTSPEKGDVNTAKSNPATITVLYEPKPPVIIYNGNDVYYGGDIDIKHGATNIEVQCHVRDGNPAADIRWTYRNGAPLPATTHNKTSDININLKTTTSKVDIAVTEQLRGEQLRCIGIHQAYATGQNSTEAKFLVPGPVTKSEAYIPGISEYKLVVGPDVSVTIVCAADGHPEPSFDWEYRKDGSSQWTTVGSSQNITIKNKPGDYVCLAKNDINSDNIRSNVYKIGIKYDDKVNVGKIVGGILAVIVVIAIILGVGIYAYVKRKWCFKIRPMKPTELPDGSTVYYPDKHKNIYKPPELSVKKAYSATPPISQPKPNVIQVPASPAMRGKIEELSSDDEATQQIPTDQVRTSLLQSSSSSATSISSDSV